VRRWHDDYIPQPRPALSDEAAAQLLDFLYDRIADFKSAYLVQIQRHRRAPRIATTRRSEPPDPAA